MDFGYFALFHSCAGEPCNIHMVLLRYVICGNEHTYASGSLMHSELNNSPELTNDSQPALGPSPLAQTASSRRRVHARWPIGTQVSILPVSNLRVPVPQTHTPIRASCRDLSVAGLGVQASQPIGVGQHVIVLMQPRDRARPNAVSAVVQRCSQRRPGLFDIGLIFETTIDIQDYIERDCFDNKFTHERVPVEAITGKIALAPGTKLDAGILRVTFQNNPSQLTIADSRSQFLSIANRLQAAIIAADTPLAAAGDIMVDLYANGFAGKALLIADGANDVTRQLVNKLPFAAVIVRPFSTDTVLCALGQALGLTQRELIHLNTSKAA